MCSDQSVGGSFSVFVFIVHTLLLHKNSCPGARYTYSLTDRAVHSCTRNDESGAYSQ